MRTKFALFLFALVLIAAACNRGSDNTAVTPTPTPTPAQTPSPTPSPTPTPTPTQAPAPKTVDVSITATGFSPNNITIKKGDTVTFKNNDSRNRWPASAPHPTHTDYPEFDQKKAIPAGGTWSFKFEKVGTWAYHDHIFPTQFGKVTVTE